MSFNYIRNNVLFPSSDPIYSSNTESSQTEEESVIQGISQLSVRGSKYSVSASNPSHSIFMQAALSHDIPTLIQRLNESRDLRADLKEVSSWMIQHRASISMTDQIRLSDIIVKLAHQNNIYPQITPDLASAKVEVALKQLDLINQLVAQKNSTTESRDTFGSIVEHWRISPEHQKEIIKTALECADPRVLETIPKTWFREEYSILSTECLAKEIRACFPQISQADQLDFASQVRASYILNKIFNNKNPVIPSENSCLDLLLFDHLKKDESTNPFDLLAIAIEKKAFAIAKSLYKHLFNFITENTSIAQNVHFAISHENLECHMLQCAITHENFEFIKWMDEHFENFRYVKKNRKKCQDLFVLFARTSVGNRKYNKKRISYLDNRFSFSKEEKIPLFIMLFLNIIITRGPSKERQEEETVLSEIFAFLIDKWIATKYERVRTTEEREEALHYMATLINCCCFDEELKRESPRNRVTAHCSPEQLNDNCKILANSFRNPILAERRPALESLFNTTAARLMLDSSAFIARFNHYLTS